MKAPLSDARFSHALRKLLHVAYNGRKEKIPPYVVKRPVYPNHNMLSLNLSLLKDEVSKIQESE